MPKPSNFNRTINQRLTKFIAPYVIIHRAPTSSDIKDPRTGKYYERLHFWIVGPNPTDSSTEGDLWYLAAINSNVATWIQIDTGAGAPGVEFLRDQVNAQVSPDVNGNIDIDGVVVNNAANPSGIPLESVADAANDTLKLQIQLATTVTPTPVDTNDVGLSSFNENQFQISSGMVSLIGSTTEPPVTNPEAGTENLGLVYSAGTGELKITSASGSALSSTNPGYVTLGSNASPGLPVRVAVSADQAFIDSNGSSEIIGNLFGKITTDDWGTNDIPFYIYAVLSNDDSTIAFMISRNPSLTKSPALANIGAPDDPVADLQSSFFSFDNLDEAHYDENSCLLIGSFRMRTAASDDWTVQALEEGDGIGYYQEGNTFTMPQAIFGAASSTHLKDNGGTAPTFTTSNYSYKVQKNGRVSLQLFLDGNTATDGAGAVDAQVTVPFIPSFVHHPSSVMVETPSTNLLCAALTVSGQNYVTLHQGTDGTAIQNASFSDGDRQISGQIEYFILNDAT